MSWNEPGRDRDPWEDGSSRSSDLDQMLKRLHQRFSRWLKRRPGPAPRRNPVRLWWLVPVVLIIIWLATGFYQVPGGSKAVNLRFGVFTSLAGPGLHWHWPWPIAGVRVVNVSERRSVSQRAQVLTRDGKLATIELTLNYRVADPYAYTFGTAQPTQLLAALASGALARAARGYTLEELTSSGGQDKVTTALGEHIAGALNDMDAGVEVNGVTLRRIALPTPVETARSQLATAREQAAAAATAAQTAAKAEIAAAHARANAIVAQAGQARSDRIAQARSEVARFEALIPAWRKSPQTTREVLREDVMTDVLSAAPKVVVAGPVGTVQIPSWPTPAASSSKAPASASAPKSGTTGGNGL